MSQVSSGRWLSVDEIAAYLGVKRDALDFVRVKFPLHDAYRARANFEFIADNVV